jgi:Fe-S-cluster-containing hydrogenase component 2/CRP-like cAMP-binding protein
MALDPFASTLLRDTDERGKKELVAASREVSLADGELAFAAGDGGEEVFVCTEGRVQIVVPSKKDGKERHVRDALPGDSFGEEAILPFAARQAFARAKGAGRAIAFPAHLVRRALSRAGAEEHEARIRRSVERALVTEVISGSALFADLAELERDTVVDAARVRTLERNEYLYREGDASEDLFLVASGTLTSTADEGGRPRVLGYASRGDAVGDSEAVSRRPRRTSVLASGPARVVVVSAKVVQLGNAATQKLTRLPQLLPTAHLFRDRHRFEAASSMLVIDGDSCLRCGQCSSACASVHEDGVSRLYRGGDKFEVPSLGATLLVPTSCQHCKNPACMPPCPTGAIGRNDALEIEIRAELCTGCGACEKACPWDNISMAPRPKDAPAPPGLAGADLAVKCDLCSDRAQGPACVVACPVTAIGRVDPQAVLPELGGSNARASLPAALPVPTLAVAATLAFGMGATLLHPSFRASGWLGLGFLLLCVGYMLQKRVLFRFVRQRSLFSPSRGYLLHAFAGALTPGLLLAHAHGHVRANPGGFALSFALASGASGLLAFALGRALPRVVTLAEATVSPPERWSDEHRVLSTALLASLSAKAELTKAIYERVLGPYDRRILSPLSFALSGRTQRQERERLGVMIDALLEGRGKDRRGQILDVVDAVVQRRAHRTKVWAQRALTAVVVVHVLSVAATLGLVAAHVAEVLR